MPRERPPSILSSFDRDTLSKLATNETYSIVQRRLELISNAGGGSGTSGISPYEQYQRQKRQENDLKRIQQAQARIEKRNNKTSNGKNTKDDDDTLGKQEHELFPSSISPYYRFPSLDAAHQLNLCVINSPTYDNFPPSSNADPLIPPRVLRHLIDLCQSYYDTSSLNYDQLLYVARSIWEKQGLSELLDGKGIRQRNREEADWRACVEAEFCHYVRQRVLYDAALSAAKP